MDELKGLTAIAWSLRKPPYLTANGRAMRPRQCYIMTLDNYLITGFGTDGREIRIRVLKYATAAAARHAAIRETQKKERQGFLLEDEPRTAVAVGGHRTKMDALVGLNEPNNDMYLSIMHAITKGDLVADKVA